MESRTISKWVTITGTLLILTIKWVIRPYAHFGTATTFFLGIAPNLIGSMLLPVGANWLINRYVDLQNVLTMRWFCVISFMLLLMNEYLQRIPVFGRTFDYYDILASAVGLCIAYLVMKRDFFQLFIRGVELKAEHQQISPEIGI